MRRVFKRVVRFSPCFQGNSSVLGSQHVNNFVLQSIDERAFKHSLMNRTFSCRLYDEKTCSEEEKPVFTGG